MADPPSPLHRSIVTVLSADVVGSTDHVLPHEPEYAHDFNHRAFEHVRAAVEDAGGTVLNSAGDGYIAAFGWPAALEGHADQACLAAWTIQHTPLQADRPLGADHSEAVRFRVGVHAGLVVVQSAPWRISGAAVNIAAKLQQAAQPGTAVVSEDAIALCRSDFELAPLPPPGAGQLRLVPAYRLDSRPERPTYSESARRYRYPLVGRAAELAELRACLPGVGARGRSIALIGEAGVGKSRLAALAVAEAQASGAQILVVEGDPLKREVAFAAARTLIAEMLHLPPTVASRELAEPLGRIGAVQDDIDAIAALFGALGAAQVTPTQVARALTTVLSKVARGRPTLLLAEDLHLIDPESQHCLQLLARDVEGLCLLATGRPEALQDADAIVQQVRVLEPMISEDMHALARLVWPTDDPSPALIDRAVARAEGLPFVIEQLARSAQATDQAGFALPESVESIIHMRLQSLPSADAARSAAQALSLLGDEVDLGLLGAVSGLSEEPLNAALSVLERFAFVHPVRGEAVQFRHHLIAEACAGTISLGQRAELHRRAFGALAARTPAPAGRNLQLAIHADRGGLDREALDYLLRAAREARGTAAAASLNAIFDRALGIIERLSRRDADARRDAEEKYVNLVIVALPTMLILGEFEKMSARLPQVLDLARQQGQPAKVSNFLSQLGMLCWFEGRYSEGVRATEEGLAIARQLGEPALIYANQLMLANVLHGAGQVDRALRELADLREVVAGEPETQRRSSPSSPHSSALSFTGWIMVETGRYDEALAFAEAGLEVAERLNDTYSKILGRNAIGRCLLLMARYAEAAECLGVALRIAETTGYDAVRPHLTGLMAHALARLGRADEGVAMAEACLAAKLDLRTGEMENYLLRAGYAEALASVGRKDEGLAMLEEALAIARRIGNPCLSANGLTLRAWLLTKLAPGDSRIAVDLAAAAAICQEHGLQTWLAGQPA